MLLCSGHIFWCDLRRNPSALLDDATVHIEDAASCGYRYTTATRLDVYSTAHRCVEWPCFTEAKSVPPSRDYTDRKGPRKGPRKDVPTQMQIAQPPSHRANIEGSASDGARGRGNCELGTVCADCARRSGGRDASGEVKRPPLNGYILSSAPYLCPFRMHAGDK